jgi:hypothetical protein
VASKATAIIPKYINHVFPIIFVVTAANPKTNIGARYIAA